MESGHSHALDPSRSCLASAMEDYESSDFDDDPSRELIIADGFLSNLSPAPLSPLDHSQHAIEAPLSTQYGKGEKVYMWYCVSCNLRPSSFGHFY